jgi:hypothetical protein
METIRPGQTVFLENAQPLAFTAPTATQPADVRQQRLGTIQRVDGTRNVVVLTDGTIVRLVPTAKLSKEGRTINLSQMQPGDELVIWLTPKMTTTDGSRTTAREYTGSASPGSADYPSASIESDEVLILRPHVQSP